MSCSLWRLKLLVFSWSTTLLLLIKPKHSVYHSDYLDSILPFYLFIPQSLSKSLKSIRDLASKSLLNIFTKLNSLLLKNLFLLRTGVVSILFLVLLVIMIALFKQGDDWKPGCIILKLKMEWFTVFYCFLLLVLESLVWFYKS